MRCEIDKFNNILYETAKISMSKPDGEDATYESWAKYLKKINDIHGSLQDAEQALLSIQSECQSQYQQKRE